MGLSNELTRKRQRPQVYDWHTADTYLGSKLERPLASNTRIFRESGVPGDSIAVKLYHTVIIRYYVNGTIELNTGGWNTPTTRNRMVQFTRLRINRVNWRFTVNAWGPNPQPFGDDDTLTLEAT